MSNSEEMKPSTKRYLDLALAFASGLFVGALFANAFDSGGKSQADTIAQATESTPADSFVVQGVALPPLQPPQSVAVQKQSSTKKPSPQAKVSTLKSEPEPPPFRPHPPFNPPKPINDPDIGSLEDSVFN